MKKMRRAVTIAVLTVAAAILFTGCGYHEDPDDIDGSDWRTYRAYTYLDWNSPEGTKKLLAAAYEDDGVIILAPDQEKYAPYPDLEFPDKIHDIDAAEDNMCMKDLNNDGYDDLCTDDMIDGERVSRVFVYDPDNERFDYSEEYSGGN
ncbi:MAG: hypothetical protein K6G22_01305 [Lachnospiraceae bacterium]|nr:hypothetical protein [Lachnospiraceae bacterium]